MMLVQARTCEELRQLGVSVSGQYWIDPDGAGRGAGPVRVHCDMRTGATRISHNLAGHQREITSYMPPALYNKRMHYIKGKWKIANSFI